MTQFVIGNTYHARSIGDSNCIFTFKVIKRNDLFVTVQDENNKTIKKKVTVRDGVETIMPLGLYSMAPTLWASNLVAIESIGDFEVSRCVAIG